MTNNYFLHTDSLKVNSFEDYKTGMSNLVKVKFNQYFGKFLPIN